MIDSTTDKSQTSKPLADRPGPGELAVNRVGVIGLGHLGHAFAVNLIEDGFHVVVYDRDPERTTALRASGASSAAHLNELADCDVVLTSLPDDDALAAVALGPSGLVGILSPMAAHISTSTVSPTFSRLIAEEHARHRQDYIAAPVLGNPDFARARKLFVLAAGPPSGLEKVRPLLERLGQRLFVIGEGRIGEPFQARRQRPHRDDP
jgi:3-hydroxyisobutyrate dehydrogenase-like beta-hydroxyacid dehydrogenase